MRRPRVQLKVMHLMLVVVVAAILLGFQATRRRWAYYRSQAAYHADCARFYALFADRRFTEAPAVPFRADEDRELSSLSSKLARPAEWSESCRSFGVDHYRKKLYWESRW